MDSLVLSPLSENQDFIPNLIAVLASPRNMTSNKSIWNYLVGTSDITCLIDTCLFPKEGDLTWGNLFFARIDSVPCFLLPVEVFHFVQVLGAPFSLLRWDAAWCMNHEMKQIRSSHFNSVQFSHSVMSNSLQHHGVQHARPPCPSPAPGVYSNLCPLSQWCHPTISSSVIPFSSCLLSFPASGSFQMSQFFTSGGQSIGVSASASVHLMNIQDWFPLG